jgi:hypothetical protein
MKKERISCFRGMGAVFLITIFSILSLHSKAGAFCVYNRTQDARTDIFQETGDPWYIHAFGFGQFRANLKPGENQCCNWQTKDCNVSGERDAPIKFHIHVYDLKSDSWQELANFDGEIRADGWLEVVGEKTGPNTNTYQVRTGN